VNVNESILCEIGRIAALQSRIEGQMAIFIGELLYLDEQKGKIITARLSFRLLLETLESLLHEEFGDKHQNFIDFKDLKSKISGLEQKRNEIVHSMWSYGDYFQKDTATRVKKKAKAGSQDTFIITLDELKSQAKEMAEVEVLLGNLRARICYHQSSLRKPR
jgi:hypothetical protein